MSRQRTAAYTVSIGLMLLQGCGSSGRSELLTAEQSNGPADKSIIAGVESTPRVAPATNEAHPDATEADTSVVSDATIADVDGIIGEEGSTEKGSTVRVLDSPSDSDAATPIDSSDQRVPEFQSDQSGGDGSIGASQSIVPLKSVAQVEESHSESAEFFPPMNSLKNAHSTARVAEEMTVPEQGGVEEVGREQLEFELLEDAAPQATVEAGVESITDLIFLTGQSNAASLLTTYDPDLDSPDSRVFAYTDQGWQVADLHQFWDEGIPGNFSADNPLREPYNNIIFQVGKALAAKADRRVGIVMRTAPGEGISHWDYGEAFYNEVQDHAIAALNAVPHKSAFDAVVWMQGETDWLLHGTADPDIPEFESYQSEAYLQYYPRKLNELIQALRSAPWYGEKARFICAETIKAALNTHLMQLNRDGDSLTGCAAAAGLAAGEDDPGGNHFSAESLRVLGQRIADIYLTLDP